MKLAKLESIFCSVLVEKAMFFSQKKQKILRKSEIRMKFDDFRDSPKRQEGRPEKNGKNRKIKKKLSYTFQF